MLFCCTHVNNFSEHLATLALIIFVCAYYGVFVVSGGGGG